MKQNNLSKIIYAFFFIALASVSCWATQESIHLSLPSFPQTLCWIVTIAFFIIASFGTKLIVDSLNQNIYLEGRGIKLISGLLIVIVFWLIFSMPTNTHTFFVRNAIKSKITSDITTTKSYLDYLKNNTVTENKIQSKCLELENQVKSKFEELKAEIENEANPGEGPEAKRILSEFADMLSVPKIESLSYKSTSVQSRKKLIDAYRSKIYALMEARKINIRNSMQTTDQDTYKNKAISDWKNLDFIETGISDGTVDVFNADDINEINNRLSKSYATIKSYNQYIEFQPGDKERYTAENQVTQVKKMLAVWSVWGDFISGKYAEHGLIYWVFLSILVDIGAFIFFNLAFKRDEYSI